MSSAKENQPLRALNRLTLWVGRDFERPVIGGTAERRLSAAQVNCPGEEVRPHRPQRTRRSHLAARAAILAGGRAARGHLYRLRAMGIGPRVRGLLIWSKAWSRKRD